MKQHPECPQGHPRFALHEGGWEFCDHTENGDGYEWYSIDNYAPGTVIAENCANCAIVAWEDEARRYDAIAIKMSKRRGDEYYQAEANASGCWAIAEKWRAWQSDPPPCSSNLHLTNVPI